ncbi:MAG: tRNA (adenosine(37)-N6)-threonylcarbamoyltransferase complex ATPase subunit type 1 TsaE [Halanaerobiales bacterium]
MFEDAAVYISKTVQDTERFGRKIGEMVEPGQIILLDGELGAGKTLMAQGICEGLSVDEDVTSPTYRLINEYEGDLPVYHMDLYRLEDVEEVYQLGFEEYIERNGVVIVEWPDLIYDLLPPSYIYIKIYITENMWRKIEIDAVGRKAARLKEGLEQHASNGD